MTELQKLRAIRLLSEYQTHVLGQSDCPDKTKKVAEISDCIKAIGTLNPLEIQYSLKLPKKGE